MGKGLGPRSIPYLDFLDSGPWLWALLIASAIAGMTGGLIKLWERKQFSGNIYWVLGLIFLTFASISIPA